MRWQRVVTKYKYLLEKLGLECKGDLYIETTSRNDEIYYYVRVRYASVEKELFKFLIDKMGFDEAYKFLEEYAYVGDYLNHEECPDFYSIGDLEKFLDEVGKRFAKR